MIWPFRRPASPIDRRNTREDWKPGDLAECIRDNWIEPSGNDPKVGDIFRVRRVNDATNHLNVRAIFLFFDGRTGRTGYSSTAFRKVRHTYEPADRSFIEKLKKGTFVKPLPVAP